MFQKYFIITKKRMMAFVILMALILVGQYALAGSLVSLQRVTTEAGNSNSAVIGILPNTEVIRQKFCFDRRVVLNAFTISFGSFKKKEVGTDLHVQMLDGNNEVVFQKDIPVNDIKQNEAYTINMDQAVAIPKGVTCCIRMSCSSDNMPYATIPTVNTTNRTDPNTYMSTLNMQTHSKSVNISYSYSYRQLYPLIIFVLEVILLFVLIFERMTQYSQIYYKKLQKQIKKGGENKRLSRRTISNFIKWCFCDPKVLEIVRNLLIIFNPLVLAGFLESMNGTALTIYPNVWLFTWILLGAIQMLFMAVIGNTGIAMLVMDILLFPVGIANLFIMNVRGTPFLPSDILGINTAAEVASTYSFSLTPAQFVVLPGFVLWCILIFRTRKKGFIIQFKKHEEQSQRRKLDQSSVKKRLVYTLSSVVPGIGLILVLYNTSILPSVGITDNVWNKVSSCKANGFYMNFFLNMHYLKVSKPGGYSKERVAEILADYEGDGVQVASPQAILAEDEEDQMVTNSQFGTSTTLHGEQPNIILIMNESLADFSLVGNVNFNQDPLPFIHSMKKNTIKGKDYVSVFGAGTSNSEFEAMTGNSMVYFPSGSNVYQQFMHDSTFSLPSYLKELGYLCDAVHPSSPANWNRIAAYDSMKFDDFVTIERFKNPEYVRYISDKESYKKVIELYENKGDQPIYIFDMTIQNHGGYLTNTNWKDPVFVENTYYTEAKEYLSATKVSDEAFEYLIDYFSKQKEPTVICMFGDHWPSIETEFFEDLLGKPQASWALEDIQKRYAVPFIIWANYEIDETDQAVISNNYLENLLLKEAGLKLPKYNRFTEELSKVVPAMNVNGYMDTEGNWHNYGKDETKEVQEMLDNYEILQYGYYSDMDKEKMGELFEMEP